LRWVRPGWSLTEGHLEKSTFHHPGEGGDDELPEVPYINSVFIRERTTEINRRDRAAS
jgi:hypothetical protein